MRLTTNIFAAILFAAIVPQAPAQDVIEPPELSVEQLAECVKYKRDTVTQIETDLAKLHAEHLETLRTKDATKRKSVEAAEKQLKAAHSRAVHRTPKEYWPEIVAKREADAKVAEEKAAAEKARAAKLSEPSPSLSSSSTAGKTWVKPHTRKDGTRVKGYWRSK